MDHLPSFGICRCGRHKDVRQGIESNARGHLTAAVTADRLRLCTDASPCEEMPKTQENRKLQKEKKKKKDEDLSHSHEHE